MLIEAERLVPRGEPSTLRAWEKPLYSLSMVLDDICDGFTL